MLELHGTWLPRRLFLYALDNGTPASDPFPWLQSLRPFGLQLYAHQMVQRSLHLPSYTADGVLRGEGVQRLGTRSVLGIDLSPALALRMLLRLGSVSEPYTLALRTKVSLGPDLDYWKAVSAFALDLLHRGQYVPASDVLKSHSAYLGQSQAVWTYQLSNRKDVSTFEHLAATMPASCWNFIEKDAEEWYGLDENSLLGKVLAQLIDSFVRQTLYGNGLYPDVLDEEIIPAGVMSGSRKRQFEQWYDGLFHPQPVRTYTTMDDAKVLANAIKGWTSPALPSSTLKLGFRLEESAEEPAEPVEEGADGQAEESSPDEPAGAWQLTLFLQAADDPSLTLSASEFEERNNARYIFGNIPMSTALRAVDELWQTAWDTYLCMTPYSDSDSPFTTALLTVEQAYHFLQYGAPRLQKNGFVIQLPSFWTRKGRRRVQLNLQVQAGNRPSEPQGPRRFGLNQWLGFNASLSLGDERLTVSELEQLAAAKVPLVQVRGQWTEVSSEEIEQAIQFLEEHNGKISLWELMERVSTADTATLADNEQDSQEDNPSFVFTLPRELESFVRGEWEVPPLEPPMSFQGKLRPYQQLGFSWLCALTDMGVGACLADDMGLGKTIQLIAFLCKMYEEGESRPTLILCPTSLLGNWQHELARFAPHLSVLVHHGAARAFGEGFEAAAKEHQVILSTYALALRDEGVLSKVDFAALAIDEAQQIKNSAGKQARAVYRIADKNSGPLCRIALSGTPVENRLAELWSVFRFIAPGYLGARDVFRERFANPIERHRDETKSLLLRRLIAPMILRRVKTDKRIISDLPDKIESKEYCPLTKEQASLYKAVVDEVMRQVETLGGMARRGLILSSLTRLKQICNHPALFLHDGSRLDGRSGKLARLTDLVREIHLSGESALVFTQYREMGDLLVTQLSKVLRSDLFFLHGGVPQAERDRMVQQFQSGEAPSVFVLSIRAGGVGLNLTKANHVIHYDRWWNPAVENQATDRAFRIGQVETVEVHKFICQGTLEERIDEMMESKRMLAEQIIGEGEGWITELGNDELRSLFSLR